jgi:hypothetical protein
MKKEEMLRNIQSVKLCMMAHPDNTEGSEFEDRIDDLDEIEQKLQKQVNDASTSDDKALNLAGVNNCLPFGEWLFDNAKPACLRGNKTKLWQLNDKTITWNDRFKTTKELYDIYVKANCC